MARVYESKAEFRSALQHEKEGYTIYKNQVQPTIYEQYIGPAKMVNDTLVTVTLSHTQFLIAYTSIEQNFACELYKYKGFIYKYKANEVVIH